MASISLTKLFNQTRFPDDSVDLLWIILYFPLGVALAFLRFHIILAVYMLSNVLPNSKSLQKWWTHSICSAVGVMVQEHNKSKHNKSVRIIISNQVSSWDHFALYLVTGCVTPCKWDFPELLLRCMGLKDYSRSGNMMECTKSLLKPTESLPETPDTSESSPEQVDPACAVTIMPEGRPTNGKGLLKFADWPFSLGETVQPVAIRTSRPACSQISLTSLGSSRNWDTFWMMFSPYTIYHITYITPASISEHTEPATDTPEVSATPRHVEFCGRVAKSIADELKIECTAYTAADVVELEKRLMTERNQQRSSMAAQGFVNGEVQRMANQVKEVLPNVPINAIIRDLAKTRSVDMTLGNILEGRVMYTPETTTMPGQSSGSSQQSGRQTSAGKFSPSDRMSFQHRKEKLIEEARERYINKHGLNAMANHC